MQFKVPQYIEMESKIIGQFTFKQVIYIGGALGISYVLFKVLPVILALPIAGAVVLFSWALIFFPNRKFGKPFIEITEAAFKYITKSRLYTWKRGVPKPKDEVRVKTIKRESLLSIPKVSTGKLKDISKNLEVGSEKKVSKEPINGEAGNSYI